MSTGELALPLFCLAVATAARKRYFPPLIPCHLLPTEELVLSRLRLQYLGKQGTSPALGSIVEMILDGRDAGELGE